MNFQLRHHNRAEFPDKHVLIAEDDILHQAEFMVHMSHLFERQGKVRVSLVSGAAAVASIINTEPVDVLILDFDMPYGNSADLIPWLVLNGKKIPIVTASGWPPNNEIFKALLESTDIPFRIHSKQEVIAGAADGWIKEQLK